MKKIFFLFFLAASVIIISCSSNKPKDLIVKKWNLTNVDIPNMPLSDSMLANVKKGKMEFTKDGRILISGMGNDQSGTYTLSDDGKTLFVITNGQTQSNEIKELTESKLVLYDKLNNSTLTATSK